jgi:pimeloyl-ACP methyl ester carboxylesterase
MGGVDQIGTIGHVSEDLPQPGVDPTPHDGFVPEPQGGLAPAAQGGFVEVPAQTDTGRLRLHYQRWGIPRQPTLVLVHGLGSSCHIWDLVAPLLAPHYAVVALDQRGHGESQQPETGYDFPSIVADLAHFLDALGIRAPSVLVGHSWGASVVLHFGASHPDRAAGIVLLDGGTSSPGERWSWDQTLARLTPPDIDGLRWSELRQRMSARNGALADPRVEAISRSLFHVDADGRIQRRFRIPNHLKIVRALWEQRPAELLPSLRCPLLVLPARQSSDPPEARASKAEAIARVQRLQPRARVRWFEDTIHDVPLQRPTELAAELLSFAREVLPVPAPAPHI